MISLPNDYLDLLKTFVSFKSISTDSKYQNEILKTVNWISDLFRNNSFSVSILRENRSNPIVFATYNNKSKETILIYGHYDVQPAEIDQGWTSDPFILSERVGKLLGRGVSDNKGQILIHMYSVFKLIKEKKLGYNVKFMIEGNEETANEDMEYILKKRKTLFKADYIMCSDGEILGNTPVVDGSLRGGMNVRIKIKTAKSDLHSGMFGGAVPNAASILIDLLDKTVSPDNFIKLEEFKGWVGRVSEKDHEITNRMHKKSGNLVSILGIKSMTLMPEENFYMKTGLTPTIQVTGIKTGYTGEGFSNIIPSEAEARLNVRIVYPMKSGEIKQAIQRWLKDKVDKNCEMEIFLHGIHDPIKLDTDSKIHKKAFRILSEVYGEEPLIRYVGGALPFITQVKQILNKDSLSVGLSNDDSNTHGPDENFSIDCILKGLEFSNNFFSS